MSNPGFKKVMAEANAVINTISVVEARNIHGDSGVSFIDVREKHEWEQGHIDNAHHAARGFLEMIVAADGPMHQEIFTNGDHLVLYCGTGGRSALAAKTLQDMGIENVSSMAGGFNAWKESAE